MRAQLLELTHDAVLVRDMENVITYWNHGAQQLYGWTSEEAVGQLTHVLLQTKFPLPLPELRARFLRDAFWEGELVHRRRDGTEIVVASRWLLQRTGEGIATAIFEINNDITPRKRAEAELRDSEERFQRLANATFEGIAIHEQGKILETNQALVEMFGYAPAELIGMNPFAMTAPEYHDLIRKSIQSESEQPYQAVGIKKDGTRFAIEVRGKGFWHSGRRLRVVAIRDISKRKRTEELLHESEERYRMLFENSSDAVLLTAPDGHILAANPEAARMFGRSTEEIMKLGRDGVVALDDPRLIPALQERARTGRFKGELTFVRADGTRFPGEVSTVIFKDRDGLDRTSMIIRDITERQRAESAVRESEERFRSIISAAAEGIILQDPDGVIRASNASAEKFFGFAQGEMIGRKWEELRGHAIHEDGSPFLLQEYPAALTMRTGEPQANVVMGIQKPNGTRAWLSVNSQPLFHHGERVPYAVVTSFFDLTERKQFEDQRAQQFRDTERARSQTRAILDATSEGMTLVSPDGTFLIVNQRFAELFGVSPDTVIGRQFSELESLVDYIFVEPQAARERLENIAADSHSHVRENFLQRFPEARELELFSTPVHTNDQIYIGRLYVFRDVTQERAVDRMKSEFVSMVSHELRTPLTSIKGYIDLLLDGEVGELQPQQQNFLTIAKNNTDRLVALISDLLDISRIEAGKLELKRSRIEIAAAIREVAASFAPQIEAKQQALALDLSENLTPIFGDPDRVHQILTNLLSNAHKYTPRGGKISITAREAQQQLQVDVTDNGIGLSPEEQTKIFARFYRARNRATEHVGGTGLGLAITRSLVELHGGEIRVTSTRGVGSTFTILFPTVSEIPKVRANEPAITGRRVLVVDDEPDIAQLLKRYLEHAGFQVHIATSGNLAFQMARTTQPDLITLDIQLPDVDGFTVLEWLKSDTLTSAIPVIVISIVPEAGRGKMLGAIDYLIKPLREQILLDHVRQVLRVRQEQTVLLADDEADTRQLVARFLKHAGYAVIEARDGAEALERARRQAPGLVLLDIKMPQLDGVQVLRALRADAATRELPVIMMTASTGALEQNRSDANALGVSAMLTKPFTPDELAHALAHALLGANPDE